MSSLQVVSAAFIFVYHMLSRRRKRWERSWWQMELYRNRTVYSGTSLLADLKCQEFSGWYKKFTQMATANFELLMNFVYVLLGISPASNCSWPTFQNPLSVPSSKAGCRLSTSSLWRWNWHRVPKCRPTTFWRRGNTQKNIYNIQITVKVWNLESSFCFSICNT